MPQPVAAALRRPGKQAIAFVGDGGALMTGPVAGAPMSCSLTMRLSVTARFRLEWRGTVPNGACGVDYQMT